MHLVTTNILAETSSSTPTVTTDIPGETTTPYPVATSNKPGILYIDPG